MKILLISTADWDHPFWTNKQHVATALADLGHEVLYVESLGIRPFSYKAVNDTGRVAARLRQFFRKPRAVREGISVVSPLVLPLWASRWAVLLNRVVIAFQAHRWRRSWGAWDLVWTYSPVTTAAFSFRRGAVLYHCVDNISAQPTMPSEAVARYEAELVQRADLIFTTAPELTARMEAMGASGVHEHTNVVDFEHFVTAGQRDTIGGAPIVGFVGAISEYKVDLPLIIQVAESYPSYEVVLIGQVGEGQPGATVDALQQLPNIKLAGPRRYDQLPKELAQMDVAILPVPINEYTKSMFPMKFFEYLAAGIPVVATDIPSLREFNDFAFIAKSHEDFIAAIPAALASDSDWRDNGRKLASRYTYQQRTTDMLEKLADLLTSGAPPRP